MTKLINMAMGILKPFNIPPSYDEETATLTAAVNGKQALAINAAAPFQLLKKTTIFSKCLAGVMSQKTFPHLNKHLSGLGKSLLPILAK